LHTVWASDPVALLNPMTCHLTTLGASAEPKLVSELARAFPGARIAALGQMQIPRFDGPVDRRASLKPGNRPRWPLGT
jgi:hypothetical protein